jgi:hypothetical protein
MQPSMSVRTGQPRNTGPNRTKTEKNWKVESDCVGRACEGANVPGAVWDEMQALLFVFGFVPTPVTELRDSRDVTTA